MISLTDGRNELYQWDTDRELKVPDECSQVHFSNKIFGRSVDVEVVDGIAKIPDFLLQSDKDLIVWCFVGTSERGYTKVSKIIKVIRRNKPNNYVFTPTEQISLEEISKRMDDIEKFVNPDIIKEMVDSYLKENPPTETDPTVPEWAKQPEKPKYTADEVGVPKPQLYAPSISISGTTLKITNNSKNSFFATGHNVYANGVNKTHITGTSIDLTSLSLDVGTYSITVTAVGEGFGIAFKESEPSNAVSFTNAISFTVDGVSYTAGINQSWNDWIESDLSPDGFSVGGDGYVTLNGEPIRSEGERVYTLADARITNYGAYTTEPIPEMCSATINSSAEDYGSITIYFTEGMTWADWCASEDGQLYNAYSDTEEQKFDIGGVTHVLAVPDDSEIEVDGNYTCEPY